MFITRWSAWFSWSSRRESSLLPPPGGSSTTVRPAVRPPGAGNRAVRQHRLREKTAVGRLTRPPGVAPLAHVASARRGVRGPVPDLGANRVGGIRLLLRRQLSERSIAWQVGLVSRRPQQPTISVELVAVAHGLLLQLRRPGPRLGRPRRSPGMELLPFRRCRRGGMDVVLAEDEPESAESHEDRQGDAADHHGRWWSAVLRTCAAARKPDLHRRAPAPAGRLSGRGTTRRRTSFHKPSATIQGSADSHAVADSHALLLPDTRSR